MTIYFTGTERDVITGGTSVTTNSQNFDPAYSLSAIKVSHLTSAGISLPIEFGANSINGWWLQVVYGWDTMPYSGTILWNGIIIKNANLNTIARISGTANETGSYSQSARLRVYGADGTSNYIDISGVFAAQKFVYTLHCYTNLDGKATIDFYVNNLLKGTVSIANISPNRNFHTVECYAGQVYSGNPGTSIGNWGAGISEFIIADESTIGMRVKTYRPTADGTHTTWAGNYDNVNNNDIGIDAISTQLSNAAETFLHGATLNEGTAIRALAVGAAIASANPTGAKAILNIDGNLYQQDFEKSLTQGAASNIAIYEDNPATGLSFTAADFNSLEFGVQHS